MRLAFLLLLTPILVPISASEPYRSWRVAGGDPANTKYSALDQINRDTVRRLKPAWIYRTGDMTVRPASTIQCNPVVVDGTMYLTTPGLKLVALDAVTGVPRWTFDPTGGAGVRGGVNRGVTYWADGDDRRIFYVVGSDLHAVNATTGKTIPAFGREGRIDLREDLDHTVPYLSVTATSPGVIYRDVIVMGSRVGEGPTPAAPGHIRGYDVRTGKRRWIFHTIPHPGETGYETWPPEAWKTVGGANCWGGMSVDEKRGLVFAATGAPSYDKFGGNRAGQNLFANCVLALDALTGKRKWHFQAVHHDIWDYDLPCAPNLVTVEHGGHRIDAVAQVSKVGHVFLLDRETGKPLFPIEERPVPASDVPGEQAWPTQPFPLRPPAYAQQGFSLEDVTDLSPAARASALKQLEGMRLGDVFTPPGLQPTAIMPQFNGGTDWGGAAFDPQTRTLYVNTSNELEWTQMVPSRQNNMTVGELGRTIFGAVCSACHGAGRSAASGLPPLPALESVKERMTREQVRTLLETGRNQMPSFAALSDAERSAVVAFLFNDRADESVPAEQQTLSWSRDIGYVSNGHREIRDPDNYPVNRRPWGTLTAIDLDAGTIRWQVPLGTYPALEAQGLPPTGTFNMGGPIVTAGGLVFIAAAMDERLHAFDKETGALVWEFQLSAGGYATPATYEIKGRQYVVIAAGGGGKPETKPGDAYYCFALPDL